MSETLNDAALLAWAICNMDARVERSPRMYWKAVYVYLGGRKYITDLDSVGLPVLSDELRSCILTGSSRKENF